MSCSRMRPDGVSDSRREAVSMMWPSPTVPSATLI